MDKIEPEFIMTVTGPKRAGKTHFVTELLKNHLMTKFSYIWVFSPTIHLTRDYDFLSASRYPKCKLCKDNFEERCMGIFSRQEELQLERQGGACQVLLVFDDCATDNIMAPGSVLDRFAIRHRHSKISIIVVGHALKGICGLPKSLRSQIDYNIIFNPVSLMELETILRESLFAKDMRQIRVAVVSIFAEKFNYIAYESAAPYHQRLLVNFKTPLLDMLRSEKKRKRNADKLPAKQNQRLKA